MTPERKHILKVWIAAGLWLVLIAIESTAYLSSEYTGRFLYPILHFLFGIDRAQFKTWHHVIRKCGHFVGYFTLSVLLFRAWKATLPRSPQWVWKWAGIAWCMSALVASMDEFHQTFLPGRTGIFSDVILDSTAALIAQAAIYCYWSIRTRKEQSA